MLYVGKLDKSKLGKYANKIATDEVVLTDERELHIFYNHTKDYNIIIKNIKRVVLNPSEILEDIKNKDTLFFINKLGKNNLNVVVKMNRDSNLKKLRKRNKIIYKSE